MNQLQALVATITRLAHRGVWSGKRMDPFTGKTLFSKAKHNEHIQATNALLNMSIVRTNRDAFTMYDTGGIIEINGEASGTGGGGGITTITSTDGTVSITNATGPTTDLSVTGVLRPKGVYSSGTDYAVNDMVVTSPTSYGRIAWVCEIQNGPSTSVHAPTWPEPGTVYWRALDQPGNLQKLTVNQTWGDYIECQDSLFTTVLVAKPPVLRFSLTSRYILGVNTTYGSFSTLPTTVHTDQVRGASSASFGGTISEIISPGYYQGDIIFAQSVDHSGVTVSGTELPLIDTNVDSRRWMMIYGQ